MIAAAGSVADGLVGHPIATRRWHREVTLEGLRTAEETAGREKGACALAPYVLTSIQESRDDAIRDAKSQIGFYYTTRLYHSILDLHGLRAVGEACRAAFRKMDFRALVDAVPDSLVDEIAIAALIPAILYFASVYFMVGFEAARKGMRGMHKDEIPRFSRLVKQAYLFAPIIILIMALFMGYSVIRAGTLATASTTGAASAAAEGSSLSRPGRIKLTRQSPVTIARKLVQT